MKKIIIVLLSILFLVTACKKDDNPVSSEDSLVGTWKLTQEANDDVVITLTYSETLQLKSDKTFTDILNDFSYGRVDTTVGTWSASNGKFTAIGSHGTIFTYDYTITDNTLVFTDKSNSPHVKVSKWSKQ
jgi:hypothetical protein